MDPFGPNDFDLLSGRAGGIVGLLQLFGALGEEGGQAPNARGRAIRT